MPFFRKVFQMTNQKPKTEQEFREWIRTLIKEVKEENKREVTK
ncbi:hypothetical protein [uncultured Mediterranean phage uvMED]|nr:hypothetical protein [uncultured Mediterranean phage uvMED]